MISLKIFVVSYFVICNIASSLVADFTTTSNENLYSENDNNNKLLQDTLKEILDLKPTSKFWQENAGKIHGKLDDDQSWGGKEARRFNKAVEHYMKALFKKYEHKNEVDGTNTVHSILPEIGEFWYFLNIFSLDKIVLISNSYLLNETNKNLNLISE